MACGSALRCSFLFDCLVVLMGRYRIVIVSVRSVRTGISAVSGISRRPLSANCDALSTIRPSPAAANNLFVASAFCLRLRLRLCRSGGASGRSNQFFIGAFFFYSAGEAAPGVVPPLHTSNSYARAGLHACLPSRRAGPAFGVLRLLRPSASCRLRRESRSHRLCNKLSPSGRIVASCTPRTVWQPDTGTFS